jgi:hypothetical protein
MHPLLYYCCVKLRRNVALYANTALILGLSEGRERESRGEESLVWVAMHLLVDEGAHYPQCAQRAIHERASGASLFLQAPAAPAQR